MPSIGPFSTSSLLSIDVAEDAMDLHISGKSVVITGASAGIGLACARGFAQEGCTVTLVSHSEAELQQAAQRINAELGGAGPHTLPGPG
jgi:NAD(P)-dependent dehydrogenase (short-subunit alcohol dehydrogenase family)